MSHFKTVIPIDLEAVKTLLPKGASVEKVTHDPKTNELSMIWHHQMLETGFTFPVEFPLDRLKAHKLPERVREREPVKPVAPPVIAPPPVKAGKLPKPPKAPKAAKAPKPAKA